MIEEITASNQFDDAGVRDWLAFAATKKSDRAVTELAYELEAGLEAQV